MSESSSWIREFPATVRGVVDAGNWLDEVATAAGFPEDLSFRVHLCVEELFTNVVRHGGGIWGQEAAEIQSPVTVTIIVSREEHGLTVVLEDNGRPFDAASAPARPAAANLDAVQPGGLGIMLVKEFSASLSYSQSDGLNRTALKFLWPKSPFTLQ